MLNLHPTLPFAGWHSSLLPVVHSRQCACRAKRGRPRKTDAVEAEVAPQVDEQPPEGSKRRGRPRKTDLAEAAAPAQQATVVGDHERVISYEMDITSSVELDYTDDASIVVPSYTHQAQGHDSNTQPPLESMYLPDIEAAGFVGEEALEAIQQQLDAATAAAAAAGPAAGPATGPAAAAAEAAAEAAAAAAAASTAAAAAAAAVQPLVQLQQQQMAVTSRKAPGAGVLLPPVALAAGEEGAGEEEEEEDLFPGGEEPPGVFDYEAGLTRAVTLPEPEQPLEYCPQELKPRSRREADYMLRWLHWVGTLERQQRQYEYEEWARYYQAQQNKESHNHYLNAKAMSIVTAEIELEDHETGNRWDSLYPVWARAEHRWYPTGRFAAYNDYVRDNIGELTMKLAPGADQEEDFDIMDDVFLMADDPASLGMDGPEAAAAAAAGAGAAAGDDGEAAGPARGLNLDSFITGVLPGAATSDLGTSYLEDILVPAEEELEEEE